MFDNKVHLIYCLANNQHTVMEMNREKLVHVYDSYYPLTQFKSRYGDVRGGTPAYQLNDDLFITFFHTNQLYEALDHEVNLYTCGAYVFEAKPPFKVLGITSMPLFKGELFPLYIPRTSLGYVVFPGGAIYDHVEKGWWVSFGYMDYENRIIFISDDVLKADIPALETDSNYKMD